MLHGPDLGAVYLHAQGVYILFYFSFIFVCFYFYKIFLIIILGKNSDISSQIWQVVSKYAENVNKLSEATIDINDDDEETDPALRDAIEKSKRCVRFIFYSLLTNFSSLFYKFLKNCLKYAIYFTQRRDGPELNQHYKADWAR
jgi:hypothetical protein